MDFLGSSLASGLMARELSGTPRAASMGRSEAGESNKANRAPRQSALLDVTLTHGQPGRPPERMNRADALSHLEMLALLLIILSQSGRNVKNK